jgi:Na+/H+-dicarboxylate symporter
MFRTATNVTGDVAAGVILARREGHEPVRDGASDPARPTPPGGE